jgi:hypothetical protein
MSQFIQYFHGGANNAINLIFKYQFSGFIHWRLFALIRG